MKKNGKLTNFFCIGKRSKTILLNELFFSKMHVKALVATVLVALLFFSCKPESTEIKLYISDLISAANGKIVEVPVEISFSLLGMGDDDADMRQALDIASRYLSENSTYDVVSGNFSKSLLIQTKIPMGNEKQLEKYLVKNKRLATLKVSKIIDKRNRVSFSSTQNSKRLNNELQGVNMMLGYKFHSGETVLEVINDTENKVEIEAVAVFVERKAEIYYSKDFAKRDSAKIVFSGKEGSMYSEHFPFIMYK